MRSPLPQCARLIPLVLFAAACSGPRSAESHRRATVNVTATCSGNQVTLTVDSSTVHFHHTNWRNPPTDVGWKLGQTDASVTIKPDRDWPFTGATPFPLSPGSTVEARGKDKQDKNHYPYTVTVVCPNGGPTAIFDPDIWVD